MEDNTEDLRRLALSDEKQARPSPAPKYASDTDILHPSEAPPELGSSDQEQQNDAPKPEEASSQPSGPAAPVRARDFAQADMAAEASTSQQSDQLQSQLTQNSAATAGRMPSLNNQNSQQNSQQNSANSANKLGALRNRPTRSNVPIPPGLRDRVMASRGQRPPPSNNSASAPGVPTTHMSQSDRLDASALLGPRKMGLTPDQQADFEGRGSKSPSPSGPGAPGSLMARRQKAGPQGGPPGRMSLASMHNGSSGPGAGPDRPQFPSGAAPKRRGPPGGLNLNDMLGGEDAAKASSTPFTSFKKIVDPSGRLSFENKAVLHAQGVDFSTGASFSIKRDDLQFQEELGRGNYGTVQKVYHKTTKVVMAMKEIRLELDESRLKGIITELDILHRASSPNIIEFYGAFFVESCVYYCMEFMDGGSLEHLAGYEVPEEVLARITACIVRGLKFLKDELQTMHRDVKPTNVLVSRSGNIKLCDFGVSAQMERSLAKTNIGCQSYMAPERIKGESQGNVGSYSVASDVWSLGLSMIEFVIGRYPYPPETYSNVFAQLQAIVHGDPPALPDGYSADADDFVAQCLRKEASRRPTYGELQEHPFLKADSEREVDLATWVCSALDWKAQQKKEGKDSPTSASTNASSG